MEQLYVHWICLPAVPVTLLYFKKHRNMNYIVLIQELGASEYTPSQNDIGLSCNVSTWGETSGWSLWQSLVAGEPARSDHRTSL